MTAVTGHEEHSPVFGTTLVYYVFSFSSQEPLDVNVIADRLLTAEIAETVASPARDDVRVAPRYRSLADLLGQARAIRDLDAVLKEKSGGLLRWARRNPRLAVAVLGGTLRGLIWNRSSSRHEDEGKTVDDSMNETREVITRSVAETQAANAIQQFVESHLFQPDYLLSEPFVRLSLRETHQWWDILDGGSPRPHDADQQGTVADSLLLLHRSGVMQLTLALRLPSDLETEDLIDLTHAGSKRLAASEFPEPILQAASPGIPESRWLGECGNKRFRPEFGGDE